MDSSSAIAAATSAFDSAVTNTTTDPRAVSSATTSTNTTTNTTTTTTTTIPFHLHLRLDGMMCQRNCGSTVQAALMAVPHCVSADAIAHDGTAHAVFCVPYDGSSERTTNNRSPSPPPLDLLLGPLPTTTTSTTVVPSLEAREALWQTVVEAAVEAVEAVGFDAELLAWEDAETNNNNNNTPRTTTPTTIAIHVAVDGMMCQRNCGATVQNALSRLPDCVHAEAVFAQRRAVAYVTPPTIEDTDTRSRAALVDAVVEAIDCVGFDARPLDNVTAYVLEQERRLAQDAEQTPPRVATDDSTVVAAAPSSPHHHTPNDSEVVMRIRGMSCAVCTGRVEQALRDCPALAPHTVQIAVVLATGTAVVEFVQDAESTVRAVVDATVRHDCAMACAAAVTAAGYECHAVPDGHDRRTLGDAAADLQDTVRAEVSSWRRLVTIAMALTIPLVYIHKHYYMRTLMAWRHDVAEGMDALETETMWRSVRTTLLGWLLLEWCLSSIVQVWIGGRFYTAAYHGLKGRVLGMDFLVCLGTTSSYVYSVVILTNFAMSHDVGGPAMDPTFPTGAMLLAFVTFGKFLESYAKGQTASALQTLMELQPLFAFRVVEPPNETRSNNDGDDESVDGFVDMASLPVEEVSVKDIMVGELLRVLPGSRIPTDGVLVGIAAAQNQNGDDYDDLPKQAFIDESALSGEPFPVAKHIGDKVTGSTVNQLAVLLVRVTAVGEATALSKIVSLMERAQRTKAPIQAYADRIACVFAPTVIVLSLVTLTAWLIFNHHVTAQERFFWAFTSSISVIVVACPCALGLATPTAVMVGTGVGAQHGLLIKGGAVLENMHSVDTIIFDKTGTLTTGRAMLGADKSETLVETIPDDDPLLQHLPSKINRKNLALWLAACAEAQSEHPLAKAIVNAARSRWGGDTTGAADGVTIDKFRVVPGMGVECLVSKPHWGEWTVRVGSKKWTKASTNSSMGTDSDNNESSMPMSSAGDEEATELRMRGQIAFYVSVTNAAASKFTTERRVVGVFGIDDPIQVESRSTIAALRRMGVNVWLCTGDHQLTATAVAQAIGIDETMVCAGVTPEGKADLVTRLQRRDRSVPTRGGSRPVGRRPRMMGRVAMVGDGINDAVALARADVGIAIGAGTEVAVEAADVVLVRSSLHDVVVALHLSKVVFRRIMMNLFWAMGYNVLALPFAAGIFYPFTNFRLPPELAGMMMAFSSVSVVVSSILLKFYSRPVIQEDGKLKEGFGCLMFLERSLYRIVSRCGGVVPNHYENVPLSSGVELV